MEYNILIATLDENGFKWGLFREYFPFADVGLREGNYQKAVRKCLDLLELVEEQELLLDLLDANKAVFLEQLWIENEKQEAGRDKNQFTLHLLLAQLQINSNLRNEYHLPHRDMRRRMMNIGADNTIAKVLASE